MIMFACMVDQLERAEVAEEKRAVFRSHSVPQWGDSVDIFYKTNVMGPFLGVVKCVMT